ncbi:hypothetical protein FKM82_014405 [Ascaphus truei]
MYIYDTQCLFAGIENLPFELQRNFQLMRDLDQRTEDLKSHIDRLSCQYMSNARSMSSEEKLQLLRQVQGAYGKCKEYGDDKVQLAMQTYEMARYGAPVGNFGRCNPSDLLDCLFCPRCSQERKKK